MAQIEATVIIKVTDVRGEVFHVERTLIKNEGDNSRFWADDALKEAQVAVETCHASLVHQWGSTPGNVVLP